MTIEIKKEASLISDNIKFWVYVDGSVVMKCFDTFEDAEVLAKKIRENGGLVISETVYVDGDF